MHDVLHDTMLSVENYRPIVLASIVAKVLQRMIFLQASRIYIITSDNLVSVGTSTQAHTTE